MITVRENGSDLVFESTTKDRGRLVALQLGIAHRRHYDRKTLFELLCGVVDNPELLRKCLESQTAIITIGVCASAPKKPEFTVSGL